jgi:ATP-dependent exoDNAse (exonuclease V) alpha subunit
LKKLSKEGISNYRDSVESWLNSSNGNVDCEDKKKILKSMFEDSHVALIYGAAGTGKTKLIEHISQLHPKHKKLFLSCTNPALNNLKSRINVVNSEFKTISSFLKSDNNDEYTLVIIDECSTVSNSQMVKILEKTSFKLLILVGDVFQIESIEFGNWFSISQNFIPKKSCFELTKPFRTTDPPLLELWGAVRSLDNTILENLKDYSCRLNETIFESTKEDEIILCLNYGGLYGINNINKFLQENNLNKSIQWGLHTYKIGDPILFNDSNPFKPLIYNNLKGKIVDIVLIGDKIKFDIEIYKSITSLDVGVYDFEFISGGNGKSIIRFDVFKKQSSDNDEQDVRAIVPFQVSYAISIHKAQGLEYNSVKIIITNEVEELISHNIFYTAITRTKEKLKIYWTPETEKKVLDNLKNNTVHKTRKKDTHLLKVKFNL